MAPSVRRITGIHARVQRGAFLSALGSRENELLRRSRTCFKSVTHLETGSAGCSESIETGFCVPRAGASLVAVTRRNYDRVIPDEHRTLPTSTDPLPGYTRKHGARAR